ncbi:DUF1501 domain-containing protein [Ideonella margarita]|uniref:DUF1501 domain-containing protein n=1 Tax=Ideonella margarita TaxID=2984191 RepID=A0ABU9BZB7_9BURK
MHHDQAARRAFLRQLGAFTSLGAAAPLALNLAAMSSASAQAASDYKAVVCLFMFGGNDAYNMFLPTDSTSFANYTAVRDQAPDSIALLAPGTAPVPTAQVASPARLGGVLPIVPATARTAPGGGTQTFGLHPSLGALQTLFNSQKRLAVLANVGPLKQPTTKAQYATTGYPLPASLFSHNDQQNTWQAFAPEGATKGWGGRMADLLLSQNTRASFTAVSVAGNAVWLSGDTVRQYQMSTSGAVRMGADSGGRLFGSTTVASALERVVRNARSTHRFETDMADIHGRSIDAEVALRTTLKAASDPLFGTAPVSGSYNANNDPKLQYDNPLTGGKSSNSLAQQFQMVARMIEASSSSALGMKRQVFFVSIGGFDSHDGQNRNQADNMAKLAQALKYFDDTLGGLNLRSNVTTFTASDFGRTFTSNGDGTDHGWGSHHFIMGGAVKGGDVYGQVPVLSARNANSNNFDGSPDQIGNGVMLPSTSVDQYGATLGRWMGLSDGELLSLFPNLANFSQRNLGFMA